MQKKQKKFVFDEKAWWPSWSGTCLIDGKWLMEEVRSELSFYAHNCVFKKSFHVSPLHASPLSEMSMDWHLSSNEWWYNSQGYEEVKEAIAHSLSAAITVVALFVELDSESTKMGEGSTFYINCSEYRCTKGLRCVESQNELHTLKPQ